MAAVYTLNCHRPVSQMSMRGKPFIHTPFLQVRDVVAKRDGRSSKAELGRSEKVLLACCRLSGSLQVGMSTMLGSVENWKVLTAVCELEHGETYVSRGNQQPNKGEHPEPN